MGHISNTAEYTFKMKQHPSLSPRTVYGMRKRKAIKDAGFRVETTYKSRRVFSVTFTKDFKNLQEAINNILFIKDRTNMIKVNMISADQTQNAEFHLRGAWVKGKQLLEKKKGAVKIVCEMYPLTSCWIALLIK